MIDKNPLPSWFKINPYNKKKYLEVKDLIENNNLATVCIEANCPNRYECFSFGTATFMILGDTCTRNCAYCNVKSGHPRPLDPKEPARIAKTVKKMGLNYAVITCVTRDDLKDAGAGHFVKTIDSIRKKNPNCKIEVLVSDLKGDWSNLKKILKAKPDVVNHNLETVKEIFDLVRPDGNYSLSLKLLKKVREFSSKIKIKSGFMVGFGETKKQIAETINDLNKNDCQIITVGQYLQPSPDHFDVKKYYTPNEFKEIQEMAKKTGIENVITGPMIRSSYKAKNFF